MSAVNDRQVADLIASFTRAYETTREAAREARYEESSCRHQGHKMVEDSYRRVAEHFEAKLAEETGSPCSSLSRSQSME